MKKATMYLIAIGLSWSLAAPLFAESASELNTKGYRLYQQKKYGEALEDFRKAWEQDKNHALAHYNYAATIGVLYKTNRFCEYDVTRTEMLEHLGQAIALDPKRRERAKQDPDFDPIHDTVGYLKLVGFDPAKVQDVKMIVERVTWYGPSAHLHSQSKLDFNSAGKINFWRLTEKSEPNGETFRGTYTIDGRKVRIRFNQPIAGQAQFEAKMNADGTLPFPNPLGLHTDERDDCSA